MSLIRPGITCLHQIEIIQLRLCKLLKSADHADMIPIKAHEYSANDPKDKGLAASSIIILLLILLRFYVFRGPAHCETALRPRKYVLLHLTCMV